MIKYALVVLLALSSVVEAEEISGVTSVDLIEAINHLDDRYQSDIWKVHAVGMWRGGQRVHKAFRFSTSPKNVDDEVCEISAIDIHYNAEHERWNDEIRRLMKVKEDHGVICAEDEVNIDAYISVVGLTGGSTDFLQVINAIDRHRDDILKRLPNPYLYKLSKIFLIEKHEDTSSVYFESDTCQFEVELKQHGNRYAFKSAKVPSYCSLK